MDVDKLGDYILISIPVIFVIILILDFYLYAKGGTEATLSAKIAKKAYELPLLPLLLGLVFGLLGGHLFWQMPNIWATCAP
jgi:hypothetical protein